MNKENTVCLLTEKVRCAIDEWTIKFPLDKRQSALLPALMIVQKNNQGWLSKELIEAVAEYLNISAVTAFEVATFYSMYELAPVGRHKISICTNISCMLNGCEAIVKHLKDRLDICLGKTTADGKITLKAVECLGACANAPVIHIGDRYYENLTLQSVDELLASLE